MISAFELSFDAPSHNLAFDEAMLIEAESGNVNECLRFWESSSYFVVLGSTCKVKKDIFLSRCKKDNIPVLRRNSGGGTVLQGPGCLNFSLILRLNGRPGLALIKESYRTILMPITRMLIKKGLSVKLFPISDMAVDNKKFSGNAQARKKHFILHHGTVLYGFELEKISKYLRAPCSEPEYRKSRRHKDFIANLALARKDIAQSIRTAFAAKPHKPPPIHGNTLRALIEEKYENKGWIYKF